MYRWAFFRRFTDEAKRAIYFAHIEAMHRHQIAISPKDLLVGLTWDQKSRASQAASLKEHAVTLRASLGIPHLPSTSLPYRRDGAIPLDSGAKKVVALAAEEADRDRQYWVDSDHLLRGLLAFENAAGEALAHLGVNLESIRLTSIADRIQHPPEPTPRFGRAILWTTRHRLALLPLMLLAFLLALVVMLRIRGFA